MLDGIDEQDVKKEASFLSKLIHPIVQFKSICLEESSIMLKYMAFDEKYKKKSLKIKDFKKIWKSLLILDLKPPRS